MLIKNVKANWLFIKNPDDNGNYRIEMVVNEDQKKQIWDALSRCAEDNKTDLNNCDWKGSYKTNDNGEEVFGAKCSSEFTNKQGETVKRSLDVYDVKAQKLDYDQIPIVANGATINCVVEPYYCEYKKKKGVMLGLRSVQLIKFEEYSGGNPYADETGENPYNSGSENTILD